MALEEMRQMIVETTSS